jgi:hypothetical protein
VTKRKEDIYLPRTFGMDGNEVFFRGTVNKPYAVYTGEDGSDLIQTARYEEDPSSEAYGYWVPGGLENGSWVPNGDPAFSPYVSKGNFITGFERMKGAGGSGR